MVIKVKHDGQWVKIPYLSSDHGQTFVEEAPQDGKQYARQNGIWSVVNIPDVDLTEVYKAINNKVDKIDGKGLSTNDYTTADRTKVTNITDVIENVTSSVTATGISITLDKKHLATNSNDNIEIKLPASTTALAGLMLPADKTKLNGIAAGAEVNVNADWNATEGDAKILNKPTLATVATSGSYNDLTNKPTIPVVDVTKQYVDNKLSTKADIPDYTVFDIFLKITNAEAGPTTISQEDYNTILSKITTDHTIYTFSIRNNNLGIVSLFGALELDDVRLFVTQQGVDDAIGIINLIIKSNLTIDFVHSSTMTSITGDGINIFLTKGSITEGDYRSVAIHTKGDGTKALMDDGTYKSIPTLEEDHAYGVEWDTASSNPDGVRVGNMQLHRELPIQSKIRGCILDNVGNVKSYLDTNLWSQHSIDYVNEHPDEACVMTEIPEHWFKAYQNGTKYGIMLSEIPLPGYKHVDKFYISSFEASINRNNQMLISTSSNDVKFRGGNNTAAWDNTYRSLLGKPVTNLSRTQFRQAARKRGGGWEMYTYGAHKTLFWLFAVEYATLNSQKPFNAKKDVNGFAQGGLGDGITTLNADKWLNFNDRNPFISCGYTNEFGNNTGVKEFTMPTEYDTVTTKVSVPRYRGIENPFGHVWQWVDGVNVMVQSEVDGGLSKVFVTDNPKHFNDSNYNNMQYVGNEARTAGYIKEVLFGTGGEIMPSVVGGSTTSYFCDYHYTIIPGSGTALRGVIFGGPATYGPNAGFACALSDHSPSDTTLTIGSRLCFFPKYKTTTITA